MCNVYLKNVFSRASKSPQMRSRLLIFVIIFAIFSICLAMLFTRPLLRPLQNIITNYSFGQLYMDIIQTGNYKYFWVKPFNKVLISDEKKHLLYYLLARNSMGLTCEERLFPAMVFSLNTVNPVPVLCLHENYDDITQMYKVAPFERVFVKFEKIPEEFNIEQIVSFLVQEGLVTL